MNWTCSVNKLFLDQSNGMKCYRIIKIIPQAFHRVKSYAQNKMCWKQGIGWSDGHVFVRTEWTPKKKKRSVWAPDDMVVPSDECVGSSYAFSGNIQRGIHAEKASTGWTDATIGSFVTQKLLKSLGFFQNIVKSFIRFPTSTRSPKMEFGAKSYGQNTEEQRRVWQDEPLVPSVQLQ
jgi:hypothetical protein